MNRKNKLRLDTYLVSEIEGTFIIPSYQRGFRWGEVEVTRLLDDIYQNGDRNYSLQPIVVRRLENSFEVIDGQQRLTTLFLIYTYLSNRFKDNIQKPKFSIRYETRPKSEEFLANIDEERKSENVDFWFIYNAFEAISKWFAEKDLFLVASNLYRYLSNHVKVIWYEVDESENGIALFTRLNIGKIPLTSAELVKAMFLSSDHKENITRAKQEEISLQWHGIETELHNDSLWYFLTNQYKSMYQTRIDLILDLISDKSHREKDKYATFFYFDKLRTETDLTEIWKRIQHTFLILKDWHEDHEFYHKIGYLIASEHLTLKKVFTLSQDRTKNEFKEILDVEIKKSLYKGDYSELTYDHQREARLINRLLLLFNVESVRQNGEKTMWFPFDKYKFSENGRVSWSLEHIHAQQSEGMHRQEIWKDWIRLHIPSIEGLPQKDEVLLEDMREMLERERLDKASFDLIYDKVVQKLSARGSAEYLHSISNLALLNSSDNAALSNSTFDVKRKAIIDMDKSGRYIPFCTKMVFLKYYTSSDAGQLHFWSSQDRESYVHAINTVLREYLHQKIMINAESDYNA